jgi:hypothetical protein
VHRSILLLATLPVMATCVPSVRAPVVPPPQQQPAVARPPQPRPADWRDWAMTPGTWRYVAAGPGRSAATFGAGANGDLLQIACDRGAQRVTLTTKGAPGAPPLTIRTSSVERVLPKGASADAASFTRDIRLAANDPLLDALAFSRGHFVVEEAGAPPLVVPAWPEVGRVIEDCRD